LLPVEVCNRFGEPKRSITIHDKECKPAHHPFWAVEGNAVKLPRPYKMNVMRTTNKLPHGIPNKINTVSKQNYGDLKIEMQERTATDKVSCSPSSSEALRITY